MAEDSPADSGTSPTVLAEPTTTLESSTNSTGVSCVPVREDTPSTDADADAEGEVDPEYVTSDAEASFTAAVETPVVLSPEEHEASVKQETELVPSEASFQPQSQPLNTTTYVHVR